MIRYRDFAPHVIKRGLLHSDDYETFDAAVAAANAWVAEGRVDLMSIETVVLPNISPDKSAGTTDGRVETEEAMTSINEWYQFLRVWYRE
jgi:hypothetical protein